MKKVFASIEPKKNEFAKLPLFEFMRDLSIDPKQRLAWAPCAAPFVMSFGELNQDENFTLREIVEGYVQKDNQADIPLIVRVLENPKSPVALPGKIDLKGHDCVHALLNCGITVMEEAFVIGFTMGSDVITNSFHMAIFKFFSRFFYPANYRFKGDHFKVLDLGFHYGRKPYVVDNIHQVDFAEYQDTEIRKLRERFGIHMDELQFLKETLGLPMGIKNRRAKMLSSGARSITAF